MPVDGGAVREHRPGANRRGASHWVRHGPRSCRHADGHPRYHLTEPFHDGSYSRRFERVRAVMVFRVHVQDLGSGFNSTSRVDRDLGRSHWHGRMVDRLPGSVEARYEEHRARMTEHAVSSRLRRRLNVVVLNMRRDPT